MHEVIRDWRYLAAHKVAADEHYERLIAEAAQSRPLAATGVGSDWRPLLRVTRQHVSEALVAVGTRLVVTSRTAQAAAAPGGSDAASSP